jgi:hypothetical protein
MLVYILIYLCVYFMNMNMNLEIHIIFVRMDWFTWMNADGFQYTETQIGTISDFKASIHVKYVHTLIDKRP